ncbi:TPA: hypothetical protein HID40_005170 [Escherichia coli]|nr:hypothetical protein [Escherichia coli]HAH5066509.1 hypothetical protein [Escherichia coli]HAH7447197.1 hypothetical protein [Escherichia coli]HAH7449030.1 hypothetical protein [Escherichia coli]
MTRSIFLVRKRAKLSLKMINLITKPSDRAFFSHCPPLFDSCVKFVSSSRCE